MANFFGNILDFFRKIPVIIIFIIIALCSAVFAISLSFGNTEKKLIPEKPIIDLSVIPTFDIIVVDDIRSGKFATKKDNYPENKINRNDFTTLENDIIDYNGTSYMGIDISTYQENIDWEKVKSAGVDFVILRVGFRGAVVPNIVLDSMFQEHILAAIEHDIDIGVYFFSQAINAEEGIEEANFVIENITPYKEHITYPVVFDWEWVHFDDNRTENTSGKDTAEAANAFCETIENAGYYPMVYTNKSMGYDHYDLGDINKYPLWLAEYERAPSFYYEFEMWQYTANGKVDGIDGNVDLNISFVDFSQK